MRNFARSWVITVVLFFFCSSSFSQGSDQRLKVFLDCSNTWCDRNYIKTEITVVDFMLEAQAADVHVLITEQSTGGGGSQYQMIFFGRNSFQKLTDTVRFNTAATNTDFERRETFIKYLKLGLTPYVLRTASVKDIKIDMKPALDENKDNKSQEKTKDPWNYWVFRVGMNGNINMDEVYKNQNISGNLSASRITEDIKLGFEAYGGKNKSVFKLKDDNGNPYEIINRNNNYELSHYLIKSLNSHWSWGYESVLSRSTFSNNKQRVFFRTGVEYNIFPYKDVNTKYLTIAYLVDVRSNRYFDTTLFDKTKESLVGHGLQSKISFNQKWGTVSLGLKYHNYLHNWKYLNMGVNSEISVRITGGLSFNIYSYAELTRDQLYLPKGGATPEEVLTRQRQLASGYYFYTFFGLNYRFGSKLNNFVNPRFDD